MDVPADELLASCYRNALRLADEKKLASIVFPAISTGAFRYPLREAAEVTIRIVIQEVDHLMFLKRVRYVLYSAHDLGALNETPQLLTTE